MCDVCDGFGLHWSTCAGCAFYFPWCYWDEAVYGPFVVGVPAASPAAADSDHSAMWVGASAPLRCVNCAPDGYMHAEPRGY